MIRGRAADAAAAGGPTYSRSVLGQRRTRQREAIDAILAAGPANDFRTARQLSEVLRTRGESVSLTTVYRTLQLMSQAGDLDSIRTDDGETAFRRCSTQHHHHLVCRVCHRTVEIAGPAVERWTARMADQHGFTEVQHELELSGLCPDCPRTPPTAG